MDSSIPFTGDAGTDPARRVFLGGLAACACASEWNEARAEEWWLEKSSAPAAVSAGGPLPQA